MKNVLWGDYTTEEIRQIIDEQHPVVIVTVGAMEQHGPHLPLNTDADIASHVAKRAAEASPLPTLLLPTIWAGFSPHHMDFAGTISLRQSTLFALVFDVIDSLVRHGVKRILLINSHGGNMSLLKTVVDEIAIQHGTSPVYVTYWHLISDKVRAIRRSGIGGMSHACELETSLKMVFSPNDVRTDLIKDVIIPPNEFHGVDMFATNKIGIYKPFKKWTPTGQIGAPSLASRVTGEHLINAIVEEILKLIQVLWEGDRK